MTPSLRPIADADGYEPLVALFADEPADARYDQVQSLRRRLERANFADSGVYVAESGGCIVGAVAASRSAGKLSSVRRPVWLEASGTETRDALFRRLDEDLAAHDVRVAFISERIEETEDASGDALDDEDPATFLFDAKRWRRATSEELLAAGFDEQVTLDVMAYDATESLPPDDDPRLVWRPATELPERELHDLIARTYRGSLDCPVLDGRREIADVLAGYRAQGPWEPMLWEIAFNRNEPIGGTFLADHPESAAIELLYLGVIESRRGEGLGKALVRHVQCRTHAKNAQIAFLAADTKNAPATHIYAKCGFRVAERRRVFLRLAAHEIFTSPPGGSATPRDDAQ